jgi:hypothetical protein
VNQVTAANGVTAPSATRSDGLAEGIARLRRACATAPASPIPITPWP